MMEFTKGGKNIYGYPIGIIALETDFPRIIGDIGNALTWDFPVLYNIVKGSTPTEIVEKKPNPKWLNCFVKSAQELERMGVQAITTTCGFLALYQEELSNSVNIPLYTSSIIQIPLIYRMLKKQQKIGIITINSKALTKQHLSNVGIDSVPLVIYGAEKTSEFINVFYFRKKISIDIKKAEKELVGLARKMLKEHPEVGAIVLECTNMPSYASSIQEEVRLPIFDIYTLTTMMYESICRKSFLNRY